MSNPQRPEIVAVYRQRSDGDYDFVAAFSRETFPLLSQADADQVLAQIETISGGIEDEGDKALVLEFSEPDMPSVWEQR